MAVGRPVLTAPDAAMAEPSGWLEYNQQFDRHGMKAVKVQWPEAWQQVRCLPAVSEALLHARSPACLPAFLSALLPSYSCTHLAACPLMRSAVVWLPI